MFRQFQQQVLLQSFHGTFAEGDVNVLLEPHNYSSLTNEELAVLGGARKEMAQEMAHANLFDAHYMDLCEAALMRNKRRVAQDAMRLAKAIANSQIGEVALVSLMRAGTVAGVLLHRALRAIGVRSTHYASNIVQGLRCKEALDFVLSQHNQKNVLFVDGWTGKGSVAGQLKEFVARYNLERGVQVSDNLTVFSDPGGVATLAAGGDEYLLPHALLRVTAMGLFSGAVADACANHLGQFDACIYYDTLAGEDVTMHQIDAISEEFASLLDVDPASWTDDDRLARRSVGLAFIESTRRKFGEQARVRPGLCEAARALVKTYPSLVLQVKDESDPDAQPLIVLAERKGYAVQVEPDLPYRAAVAVVKTK